MKLPLLPRTFFGSFLLFLVALTINAEAIILEQYPKPDATQINPDLHLKLIFEETPVVGSHGKIRVYDAADGRLVDELDMSIPAGAD